MFTKKDIPNILSVFRLLGSLFLIFTEALSKPFFIIYTITAVSDALDGFIARRMNTVSELGAKLDSICDITLYFVLFLKLLPEITAQVPVHFWYFVAVIALLRIFSYVYAAVKFHRFSSLHTRLNKLTSFCFFATPFAIVTAAGVPFLFIICAVSALATAEELCIHIRQKEYRSNIKSAFETKKKGETENDLRQN